MLSKQDFLNSALADIDNYPALAVRYRAADPTVTQHLGAIAQMLSDMSQHVEIAHLEAFQKARDATILADAAMRGVIPRSEGVRVVLTATNPAKVDVLLEGGRVLLDSSGNAYYTEKPVTLVAGEAQELVVKQGYSKKIVHTVEETEPFYAIEIPQATDGSTLSTIAVYDDDRQYEWRNQYTNTKPDEYVFHVEIDDRQRVYVRLGYRDVVAFQPPNGYKITLDIGYTLGDMTPPLASPFALDYTDPNIPAQAALTFAVQSVAQRGQDPIGIDVLRDLARYPSVYSDNAVFLGQFDFYVRKKFPNLRFCCVWNEAIEELVRGASIRNINTLFVAVMGQEGLEPVKQETVEEDTPPDIVLPENLTDNQRDIRRAIWAADDSYRIQFYTPVISKIKMSIRARVATSYNAETVRAQISAVLMQAYGQDSPPAKRGYNRPLYQQIYDLLKAGVPALSGGDSDFTLNITEPSNAQRPELWRYVCEDCLDIRVTTQNIVVPSWGG